MRISFLHLLKSIFHLILPRKFFGPFNGEHARDRFSNRYSTYINYFEYELINLKIILGHFESTPLQQEDARLYYGHFKGINFFAVYDIRHGNIATFLTENMVLKTYLKISVATGKSLHEKHLYQLQNLELIFFDSEENLSIYAFSPTMNFIFSHNDFKVKAIIPNTQTSIKEYLLER
jgi:hypothetical protein